MLRITEVSDTGEEVVLRIEGRVAGADVALVEQEGERRLREGRRLVVELDGAQFIDRAGVRLLQRWSGPGLVLRGGSAFIEALLKEQGLR
jgi:anti-anti-sigma regulatory factor